MTTHTIDLAAYAALEAERDALAARLAAIEAERRQERERIARMCDKWARTWNDVYEESSRRSRGRVMYHLIGTAVWAIGSKVLDGEHLKETD